MKKMLVALCAAASCVPMAQAQQERPTPELPAGPALTLEQAVTAAGGAAPAMEAAKAGVEAAAAGRTVAGLRPNPSPRPRWRM